MNPNRLIAVCAIVSGIVSAVVGGIAALSFRLLVTKIEGVETRVGNIEQIFINQGVARVSH
jgi:hypothetical protein